MTIDTQDVRGAALEYLGRGWAPIPIPFGQKVPENKCWPQTRLTEDQIASVFAGQQNIGVLLGAASGSLIDIDLDVPEAMVLAPIFLPQTQAIFGRPTKPNSHYLFLADPIVATARFQDPDGTTLVELRSTGCQTVFPPSTHSGEKVSWYQKSDPARVDGQPLHDAVAQLAAAVLVATHWPQAGGRQAAALALAGGLLRAGRRPDRVKDFIHAVAVAAKDEETQKRAEAAEYTDRRIAENQSSTGWPRLAALIGRPVVDRLKEWLAIDSVRTSPPQSSPRDHQGISDGEQRGQKPSQAQTLVVIAGEVELFHTPNSETYAAVPVDRHSENWPVRSKGLKEWLVREFYRQFGKSPGAQALQDALSLLEARARFDGPEHAVLTRIAKHGDAIYLDLCNANWEVVEITAQGWRVVGDAPVRFRRSKGMLPLPHPAPDGSVEYLRDYINANDDRTWKLIVAFLVAAFRPTGPYPILMLEGEAGSAKSTVSRMLRALVDPSTAPLRAAPRDERDLMIAARNGHLLSFDNLSHLPPWFSDALCRVATGGGWSTRELFTDLDEVIFEATRPVILNGIEDLATRADLADRGLTVTLVRIPDESRRPEQELWKAFEDQRPAILGALLDAVSAAIRNVGNVRLSTHLRMADFALWVSAAESALNWPAGSFMSIYQEQRRDTAVTRLESDPDVVALQELLTKHAEWSGTATELLSTLNTYVEEAVRRARAWPQSPRGLSDAVRRAAPFLRDVGIDVEFARDRRSRKRLIIFRTAPQDIVPTVLTSPTPGDSEGNGRTESPNVADETLPRSDPSSQENSVIQNSLTYGDDPNAEMRSHSESPDADSEVQE